MSGADPVNELPPGGGRQGRAGLRLRIVATAAIFALAGLSAARHASASFDEPSIPIGDVSSHDGIVSGTVRLTGDRLVFFSGDRFQSNQSSLAVNFASGGSLVLCPHSQVQILSAGQNTGVMLAFADGGSEQAFPVHPNDIVMTPDWRIQMAGDVHPGDLSELQLATSRRGDLCISGVVQTGAYFHISQLVGDTVFNFPAQGSVRIANGAMESYPTGCSCDSNSSDIPAGTITQPAYAIAAGPAAPGAATSAPATTALHQPSAISAAAPNEKQRPQDVAGYVRSFIRVVFGR
jgi:hypothetical protein